MTGSETPEAAQEPVRAQFVAWAEIYTPGTSPLYEALSRIVVQHGELLALAARARPGQPAPNMLFGAVQMVLLGDDPGAELGAFYPGLGGTSAPDAPGLEEAFLAFCRKHRERLAEIIATRVTNTNEVRRSACLMPAFVEAARSFGRAPFHLIEIGPSAGLNLVWDRYTYRYPAEDGTVLRAGDEDRNNLVLECFLRGPGRPDLGAHWPPSVASRLGIERDPVDLTDPQERLWLQALVWPEHRERAGRLERALALAAADPPPVRPGDALVLLPEVLAALPGNEPACVAHSSVLYQFSAQEQDTVRDCLARTARELPVIHVSFESPPGRHETELTLEDVGRAPVRRLAFCDPHGAWLEWRAGTGTCS